jgi:hypothetical protein
MLSPSAFFILATSIAISCGELIPMQRELVFEKIGGYQPLTDVRDHVSVAWGLNFLRRCHVAFSKL